MVRRVAENCACSVGSVGGGACAGKLASGEDRTKSGVGENASDYVSLFSLNLDSSLFDGASRSTDLLHQLGLLLFFGLLDSDKPCDYRDCLAAAMRCLTDDIHPTTILLGRDGRRVYPITHRWFVRRRWEIRLLQ